MGLNDSSKIIGALVLTYFISYLLYIIYYAFGLYGVNPFLKTKKLTKAEIFTLEKNISPIRDLNSEQKEKLYKRTAWIKAKKKFIFHGDIVNKEQLRLLVSASSALLTLGLRNYKWIKSIRRIIVYPTKYYSRIKRQHHLGEYNAGLKILVFAADIVQEGFDISNDNKNLAIHEFAHALCFETKRKNTWEARKFQMGLRRIRKLYNEDGFQERLKASNYFRAYGQTNMYEFVAVIFENYLETPSTFKREFPDLYDLVRKMLNIDFLNPNWKLRIKLPYGSDNYV